MRLPLIALTVASFHGCAPPMRASSPAPTRADPTVTDPDNESDVLWIPAQDHRGENIGTTPTEVLLVEIKASTPPQR